MVGREEVETGKIQGKRKNLYLSRSEKEDIVYDGLVWCPTTPNGTWFARREGTVYFTGNSANPAAMFYAQDPATGIFYAYYEYLPGQGRSTYEHTEAFKAITKGYNVIARIGGNQTTEDEIRQGYTAHGWHIQAPKWKHVEKQIENVYALHKLNKVKVFSDLIHYLDQKMSFSYELDEKYQPTDKLEDEAKYHLLAAERYLLSDFTPETVAGTGRTKTFRHY